MGRLFKKNDNFGDYKSDIKLKYIDDDPNAGILIDWKLVFKEYEKLKVPSIYFTPLEHKLESGKYIIDFSQRSIGKTTGWLILALILYKLYGIGTCYIRTMESDIAPKVISNLWDAVKYNGYIQKVFGDKWNNMSYDSRRWYLSKTDHTGQIVERDTEPIAINLCVANASQYKSSVNLPRFDLLLYDEFIDDRSFTSNNFFKYCDLVKTVIRDRRSPLCVCLSNNINKYSSMWDDFEIGDQIRTMRPGEVKECFTDYGTKIEVKYVAPDEHKKAIITRVNKLFFGFKNSQLGSITGADWSLIVRQHIPEEGEYTYICKNIYIYHNQKYVRLDIVNHSELGVCMFAHWATTTYDDSYILTLEDRTDPRYRYGLGSYNSEHLIMQMLTENRVYYASNDIASFISNYIKNISKTY